MSTTPNVYACIAEVSAEIAKEGIAKSRSNQQQGYKFRGIDDVYNALAPILAKHHLVILPRMLSREQTERQSRGGGSLFCVVVDAEFDFVSTVDGSKHTTKAYGEAMDSADKATNKAMSAAYKYTAFQTFCIPTEGDNDADGHTPEPVAAAPAAPAELQNELPPETAPQQRSRANGHGADLLISEPQGKRFYALAKKAGFATQQLQEWLQELYGLKSIKDIPRRRYNEICKAVEIGPPHD